VLKKVVWLLVSCLMVLSLAMASCGPAAEEEEEEEGVSIDEPQYGGKLTIISPTDITVFGAAALPRSVQQGGFVIEQILGVDRTRGPAGTGEGNFGEGVPEFKYVVGNLAESWEAPEVGVWKLKIRQGVHFASNMNTDAGKLVNNREMTAEDVAYSIEYLRDTPSSWVNSSEPALIKNTTVDRTGPWEITVNTPEAATTGYLWIMGGGGSQFVWPKEMLDKYGTSNEWQDQVGTGPFILTDFTPGSAAKYIKNDNYWDKDPVGPGKGNQLPYADGIDFLIVPDLSTRLAALRTGKADWTTEVLTREDTETLLITNPDMKKYQTVLYPIHVGGRVDMPDKPFSKKKVRQAMMLAINHPEVVKDLYNGQADFLYSPASRFNPTVHIPLEEQPEIVQEMYGFHPDKAKQFLAEAGYPNGFKTKMVISSQTDHTTAAELIKAYWADVGIDVEIAVNEPSAWTGLWARHQEEDLLMTHGIYSGGNADLFVRYSLGYYRGPNVFNISHVNDPPGTDPVIEAAYEKQAANVMVNYPAADKAFRDIVPYILENAFLIQMPAPWGFRVWQPWMKNYYGEGQVKFWLQYAWVDQDLKEEMTGSR
jgi:ABC-type transport system substrate-binding protein